jgi:hypothetical protein
MLLEADRFRARGHFVTGLCQDLKMMRIMTDLNFGEVLIGVEEERIVGAVIAPEFAPECLFLLLDEHFDVRIHGNPRFAHRRLLIAATAVTEPVYPRIEPASRTELCVLKKGRVNHATGIAIRTRRLSPAVGAIVPPD